MNLAQLVETGHFTKVYDPNRTIPQEKVDLLLRFLHSIPHSVNAQVSHYFVAQSLQARSRIAGTLGETFAFNVPKIMNCSMAVVFATRFDITESYLDELHAKEIADGKFPTDDLQHQWKNVVRFWIDSHRYDAKDLPHWAEKQTYFGLGMAMMAIEELGLNGIPIEGFDSKTLDKELGLREKGLTASVLLAIGYRHESDFHAKTPKSRLPMDRQFTFLG